MIDKEEYSAIVAYMEMMNCKDATCLNKNSSTNVKEETIVKADVIDDAGLLHDQDESADEDFNSSAIASQLDSESVVFYN